MTHNKIHIYQLLPRLFANTNTTCKKNGTLEENGCGTLDDISEKALQEIKDFGMSHIWFTGIIEHATKSSFSEANIEADHNDVVKGEAGSPYAIKDYFDIAPALSADKTNRLESFENLVERTHQAGLKVIIDFVPNHTARTYHSDSSPKGIQNLGADDMKSISFHESNNYYYLPEQQLDLGDICSNSDYNEFPAKVTGNDCFNNKPANTDWYETVKLNYGKDFLTGKNYFYPIPSTWVKMHQILEFWISKGVDAFRCDMAEMVPVEFWHWAITKIKETHPQVLFIGEVYNPSLYKSYIDYGKFDYLYDKVGLYDTVRAIMEGKQSASDITHCWQNTNEILDKMLYFLENHDEQRIASDFFVHNPWIAIPGLLLISTMGNNPTLIYCGQEVGETGMEEAGYSGSDGRTTIFDYWCMPIFSKWVNNHNFDGGELLDSPKQLREVYKSILNYAINEPVINEGSFYDLQWCNNENPYYNKYTTYSYLRHTKEKVILFILNFSNQTEEVTVILNDNAIEETGLKTDKLNAKEIHIKQEEEVIPFLNTTHNSLTTPLSQWGFKVFELTK